MIFGILLMLTSSSVWCSNGSEIYTTLWLHTLWGQCFFVIFYFCFYNCFYNRDLVTWCSVDYWYPHLPNQLYVFSMHVLAIEMQIYICMLITYIHILLTNKLYIKGGLYPHQVINIKPITRSNSINNLFSSRRSH